VMREEEIDLSASDLVIIRDILRRHVAGLQVWAFGSRVSGRARQFSDLDLCIVGEKPLPPAVAAALAEDFSNSDLPFKVDLVDWITASPTFRDIILSRKVVVQQAED